MKLLIVCSGPSFNDEAQEYLKTARGFHVIAINGAIDHLDSAFAWFTLDPCRENRARMIRAKSGTRYIAAVPADCPLPRHVERFLRVEGDGYLSAKKKLCEDARGIHTGNSAWGALGLAYHWGAQEIAFVGLDGKTGCYFYPGPGPRGSFDHLPDLFRSALPQLAARGIEVVNGSPASRVDCFFRMEPIEAMKWLGRDA